MKLFVKILLGVFLLIVLLVIGLYVSAKMAGRPGPDAPPLASLGAEDFQAAVTAVAAERKLVGMVGRVDVGDRTVAVAQTGLRMRGGTDALDADDPFHVGSIGKSMSATVIATLVEDGVMAWDDTLGARLPDVPMHEGWRDVRLHQLLTHTASAPPIPISAMINSVSEPVRLHDVRREIAAKMLKDTPDTPPGSAFAYSNAGFMLASIMAEEATGESWETLVRTRLAAPLDMDTLGFGAPQGDAPWGHSAIAGFKMAMDPMDNADNPPFMAAAGTMHMGLDDLIAYGRAHLDAGRRDGAILRPESFERLHTPVMEDYAYGWVVQSRDFGAGEETVIWHNGSNTMWYAVIYLLPERDAVIVLATNDGSGIDGTQRAFDELAAQIATHLAAEAG